MRSFQTGFLPENKSPYALTPNTVELMYILGELLPLEDVYPWRIATPGGNLLPGVWWSH